jgi:hypothetical protein
VTLINASRNIPRRYGFLDFKGRKIFASRKHVEYGREKSTEIAFYRAKKSSLMDYLDLQIDEKVDYFGQK